MDNTGEAEQTVVVVADDETHIRAVVASRLRSAGFCVHEARDGQEAFELAEQLGPSIVVTDLQMPRMSGLELCQSMRRTAATAHVPAILLTARGYILTETEVAQTNIRLVMSKPFSARALLGHVQEILARRAAAPEARGRAA